MSPTQIGPWIDPTYLYRYLLVIHSLACFGILIEFFLLRLRPVKQSAPIVKIIIWACLIIPIVQTPISVSRLLFSLAPEFSLSKPFDAYLNFIWSPMCTTPLIWAAQIYLATRCKCQFKRIKGRRITYIPHWYLIISAFGIGMLCSHGVYTYSVNFSVWDKTTFLTIMTLLTMFGGMLEILIPSIWKNTINTVCYSIVFFIGTWAYFLNWIPR